MNAPVTPPTVPPYHHSPLFPLGPDKTPYRKLEVGGVKVEKVMGKDMLMVAPEALRALAEAAFTDINHLLRPAHLKQLRAILDDPQASANDKFVAYDFLKNANISAGGVLPMCQDTGTAIIMGKKGRLVFTDGSDEGALAEGARDAYLKRNLRYSQLAPISMFEEKNTKNNMPAQVEIYAEGEDAYKLLFIAKGGGSANKSFLFQATPSILTHDRMLAFLKEKVLTLGTAACPPYHLAIVIGGTSVELTMKTVKLAFTILRCADGSYYTGTSRKDLEARVAEHNSGQHGGYVDAQTRSVGIARWRHYSRCHPGRSSREWWSRAKKEALTAGDWNRVRSLAQRRWPHPSKRRASHGSSGCGNERSSHPQGGVNVSFSGAVPARKNCFACIESPFPQRDSPCRIAKTRAVSRSSVLSSRGIAHGESQHRF